MIFYTILFSLGDPYKNEYVYCGMIWLKSLFASGSVRPGDRVAILCDPETRKRLSEINIFKAPGVELVDVPRPKDCRDGMTLKYVFRPQIDEVVVYADVDQIFKKPFRLDGQLPPDTICVYPEGDITNANYCGDYKLSGGPGVSAGIWAYRRGPTVDKFLEECRHICSVSPKRFYTLDQPHFNAALAIVKPQIKLMNKNVISFNGHNDLKEAAILNLCGDPGYGSSHLTKMLDMLLVLS